MRKIIENQLKIGQVDIASIELDLRSRDEIPQLLLGLQAIYKDRPTRRKVFEILEQIIPDEIDADNGRPGMWTYGQFWCWVRYGLTATGITTNWWRSPIIIKPYENF